MRFVHLVWIGAAFGAGFLAWNAVNRVSIARAADHLPQATVEYLERAYDGGGRETGLSLHAVSLRRDGSVRQRVRKWWTPAGDPGPARNEYFERIHLWDLATRKEVHLYPTLGFKSTLVLRDAEARRLLARGSTPCEGVPDGAAAGEPVVRRTVHQEESPGGNRIVINERRAPALGCFALVRWIETTDRTGKLVARHVREVISIRRGEPEARDFEVPPGLVEKTPGEIMLADAARRGQPCSDCARATAARADRRYAERRAP